jgi:hypothetical protein
VAAIWTARAAGLNTSVAQLGAGRLGRRVTLAQIEGVKARVAIGRSRSRSW